MNGNSASEVPGTVRTYVTQIRQAIRKKLKVGKYATFYALRKALAKAQGRSTGKRKKNGTGGNGVNMIAIPATLANDFAGVELEKTPDADPKTGTNGALFHDLAVVFTRLPDGPQSLLGRQLSQLLHKYLPMVKNTAGLKKAA